MLAKFNWIMNQKVVSLSSALENNKPVKEFITHSETNSGYVLIELALDIINLGKNFVPVSCRFMCESVWK